MIRALKKLSKLAINLGMNILSIELFDDEAKPAYRIVYHNVKKAGRLPVKEFCRDDMDYRLKMRNWRIDGSVFSDYYSSMSDLLAGETQRLEQENKK